jgi:hypothetical protein
MCTFSWNVNRRFFTIFISQREPVITVCELLWVEVCLIILTLVFSFNRSYFGFVIPTCPTIPTRNFDESQPCPTTQMSTRKYF